MLHKRQRSCIQGWNLRLTAHFYAVKSKWDISNICAFASAAQCLLQCRDSARGTLPFQRVQAPSDVGAPEIAARELCLELPCELVSSAFTPPGRAEQNPNLTPLLEYHLGQTGGKAQPDFTKDPQSKALLQLAARTPHMCTELEGSENLLQNIFHFFIIPPLKKNVIPNIPFLSSEDWKSADLSLSAILNLGSSGTTWTHCWVLKHQNYCLDLHLN